MASKHPESFSSCHLSRTVPRASEIPYYIPVTAARELSKVLKTSAPRVMQLYLIMRAEKHRRGGWFAPGDVMDVLHAHGRKELHRGPGNNRKRYWSGILPQLIKSGLFEFAGAGNVKIIAMLRIPGGRNTSKFKLNKSEVYSHSFTGFFIAALLCRKDGQIKTIPEICRLTGFSRAQVYRVKQPLEDAGRISKTQNIITARTFSTLGAAKVYRFTLLKSHKIATPAPIQTGDGWAVAVYAGCSYFAGSDAPGSFSKHLSGSLLKGLNHRTPARKDSWFVSPDFYPGFTLWQFGPLMSESQYLDTITA